MRIIWKPSSSRSPEIVAFATGSDAKQFAPAATTIGRLSPSPVETADDRRHAPLQQSLSLEQGSTVLLLCLRINGPGRRRHHGIAARGYTAVKVTPRRLAIVGILAVALGGPIVEMFDRWDNSVGDANDTGCEGRQGATHA